MEKLIYPVWKKSTQDGDALRDDLLQSVLPGVLEDPNVRALRFSVVDSAVEPASGKRMENCQSLPDAVVSVWVNAATSTALIEHALSSVVERFSAYLVLEAEQIVNNRLPVTAGERGHGFCQLVFLQRPARLSEDEWLAIWQGSHTQVAIDTQSTFGYRQNVIVRAIDEHATPFSAMIEENFPPEAMSSDHAFYDADNDEQLKANMNAMIESCTRFIDFDKIDVIPMSEYILKSL